MTGATGTGLLEVSGLSRRFGGLVAVSGLAFSVARNEIFGIIGPNGAGKSTAVHLISGVVKPHVGTVRFDGNDVTGMAPHALVRRGLVRTFQSTTIYGERTVEENCLRGAFVHLYPGFASALLGTPRARRMQQETASRVREVLDWLDLRRVAHLRSAGLPYGAQKTLGMAMALVAWPRLLLLDEPAAGLSAEEADHVRDTIRRVRERGIAVVVIDHNMRFMADLCDRILVMHHGQELCLGRPQAVLANQAVIEAYLGRAYARTPG
jgi:branched-chain amino acid transport system ATP-binding protein